MMEVIELIKVILLGVVEGISEWLPISSTGHMILLDEFIQLNTSAAFKEMFFVVIQLGAILAVVVLFFDKLNPITKRKNIQERRDIFSLWGKVLVACIPAAIIGLLFDDAIDALFYNYQTVTFTLILYGALFIFIENKFKDRRPSIKNFSQLTYKAALFIGVFQLLALIPGTSRSGATIIGAMLLGTSRYIAAEFSFFLAIPVMVGASALKLVKYFAVAGAISASELFILFLGMGVAFITSVLIIKFLMSYIKKHDFKVFGWYRIVLGVLVFAYFFFLG